MLVGDHLVGTGRKRDAVQGHGVDSKMRRVWVWVSVCHVFCFISRVISYYIIGGGGGMEIWTSLILRSDEDEATSLVKSGT